MSDLSLASQTHKIQGYFNIWLCKIRANPNTGLHEPRPFPYLTQPWVEMNIFKCILKTSDFQTFADGASTTEV